MPRRSREEEAEESSRAVSRRVLTGGDDDGAGASLFRQELAKHERAIVEQMNRFLHQEVRKIHPKDREKREDGTPVYFYFTLMCEYMRCMCEVDLRYGGKIGTVYVFGSNDMYQQGLPKLILDDEQMADNHEPHQLGIVIKGVRQVRAGGTASAVLTVHGVPWTWGCSDDGTLGRKQLEGEDAEVSQATPAKVTGFKSVDGKIEDGTITQLDIGAAHIVYLSMSGNVYISGMLKDCDSGVWRNPDPRKEHGAADNYGVKGCHETPVHIPELKNNTIAVFAGDSFCAALTADRELYTWGFGNSGELARSRNMLAPDANGKFDLTTNAYINKEDDGQKDYKFVLDKFLTPAPVLWQAPGRRRKVMNVACGSFHLLVGAVEDGQDRVQLYASGLNQYGQLGLGDTEPRHALEKVPYFEKENLIVGQLAAGAFHSMALTADGTAVYTWGRGDKGVLGIGTCEATKDGAFIDTPQRAHTPRGLLWKQVACGEATSMALTVDEELYTWGFEGVTGHGGKYNDSADVRTPRLLEIGENLLVHSMDCGAQHGLFLASPKPEPSSPQEPQMKRRKMQ